MEWKVGRRRETQSEEGRRKEPPGLFRPQMACCPQSQALNAAEMVSGKEGEHANEAGLLTRSPAPLPLLWHTDVTVPSVRPRLPAPKSVISRNLPLVLSSKKRSEGEEGK